MCFQDNCSYNIENQGTVKVENIQDPKQRPCHLHTLLDELLQNHYPSIVLLKALSCSSDTCCLLSCHWISNQESLMQPMRQKKKTSRSGFRCATQLTFTIFCISPPPFSFGIKVFYNGYHYISDLYTSLLSYFQAPECSSHVSIKLDRKSVV